MRGKGQHTGQASAPLRRVDGGLDDGLVTKVQTIKDTDGQVQRPARQARQLQPAELQQAVHWATRGAAS
jgi:hypothetical protein